MMVIHNIILPFIVSLAGLALGYLFAFLAPEEVKPGEKYFRWLKRALLLVFVVVMGYGFFREGMMIYLVVFTAVGLAVGGLDLFKLKKLPGSGGTSESLVVLGSYAFFAVAYFLTAEFSVRLLLASLIFLYGLPAGTLLRKGIL